MAREAVQRTQTLPEKLILNKEFSIPNSKKKFKLRKKSRWNWIKPRAVAYHEAGHGAIAPDYVIGMTCKPGNGAQGMTFFKGEFNGVMAAGPAWLGCGGCGGDHTATILHGQDWEKNQEHAGAVLSGRMQFVWLLASALEEDGTLSGEDVQEVKKIWEEGHETEIVLIDETGKEEDVVDFYRVKGDKIPLSKDILRAIDLPQDEANDNTREPSIPKPLNLV